MIPDNLRDYYKLHAKIYDATRWAFLFGRNSVSKFLPNLPQNPSILDFGCGTGLQLKALVKHYPYAQITGIDQSVDMLEIARRKLDNVEIREEIYSKNSFPEASFNLIVASYSLSMVDDLPAMLEAFKKHLKPSGFLLVVDFDTTPLPWFNLWMERNHVHFDDQLFKNLPLYFDTIIEKSHTAYFGLYTYSSFLGRLSF